ncbi:two-component sensor histidine kinase [Paenibacillus tyrfis]|uniref:sensor histidine kinase n=1 Tax=Paenibacillus tyrfis TaxID=1501230 RepID=UPI002492EE1F|nr:HAMP domain-containing sensor histidine kinase [Paenibacillus tyrfis]GLI08201.1 two-component sensor histidine kinase [Paenibacillus tyrfis]
MSIKVRLVLSYFLMLIVPVILAGVAFLIIVAAFFGDVKSLYNVDMKSHNAIEEVIEKEAAVSAELKLKTTEDPDSLLDPAVVAQFEERLKPINMGLVIRKQESVAYVSEKLNKPGLLRNLPPYGVADSDRNGRTMKDRGPWFLSRQYDFRFKDGIPGSIFVATDMNFIGKFARTYTSAFFISLLVILVLTNGLLTYWVSRSVIRPLRQLQRAAGEIREGNLDFEVNPQAKDEIGELAVSFEQMRRRLKQSVEVQLKYEENRKELISNISHDLKTPVTAIKGYVEGIMDGVSNSPDKLDKYLKTIYAKAVQMDHLIDELFLFSKLDLKKLPFHFEPVNLNAFLQDCTLDMQLHADIEKKGVTLRFDAPETQAPVWVTADREKLKRVLVNLIGNAIKYMDKDEGLITLRMRSDGERVIVEVRDNGQGIPPEALPHIFDRFYRADPSRNSGTGGSGLGLAIAKHIIEEHGGVIQAKSTLGEGTSVYFTLHQTTGGEV